MKKFLFLLLGLTIAVGASADVDPWLAQHSAMSQARAERVTHKQFVKRQKAHDLSQSTAVKGQRMNNLRDGDPIAIYEQPEGTLVTYKRSGWYCNNIDMVPMPQMGYVSMVYDPDGTTVYIQDLVFGAQYKTWVRGTIADGKLTVPMGQYVYTNYYNGQYRYGSYLAWSYVVQESYEDENYPQSYEDSTVTEVTYTIDGDSFIMDNSVGTANTIGSRGLSVAWDDADWSWGTEWNTTFTRAELPTVIENQPQGTPMTYKRNVQCVNYSQNSSLIGEVNFNVVYDPDGQTVYIKDPVSLFDIGSWVEGTVNGNKITVQLGQYLYYDGDENVILVWGTNTIGPKNQIFTIDPSVTEVTFTIGDDGYVTMDNSSSGLLGDGATGLAAILDNGNEAYAMVWNKPKYTTPIYDRPDGTLVTYIRGGSYFGNNGEIYPQGGQVNVVYAPDGKTVYIQDILCGTPFQTWVEGTIEDNKIHMPMGQFIFWQEEFRDSYGYFLSWAQIYYDQNDEMYRCHYDPSATEATFTINGDVITMDNSAFGPNNDAEGAVGLCAVINFDTSWIAQCDVMTEFSDPTVGPTFIENQPEGELVTYNRSGYGLDSYGRPTAIHAEVNIVYADDGQTVYIQDPVYGPRFNTWVKGTISDGKIHVPLNQYVNLQYGVYLAWGTCTATATVDPDDAPFVFTPDADATEFTYTISGNRIIMDNTTAGDNGNGAVGLAILQDNGDTYFMMEFNSVFNRIVELTIIEEQPEGELVTYNRSGYTSDWSGETIEQSGTVNLVYAPDGNTVYIQDIIYHGPGTWVMGTIEGNKIHVPLGQAIASLYVGPPTKFKARRGNRDIEYIVLGAGLVVPDPDDEGTYMLDVDPSLTEITFTISGNVISLDNTCFGPNDSINGAMVIAAIYQYEPQYFEQCDLLTVFSADNPDVTPGDVNGDNEVKINDVTALIDLLLSGNDISASIATDVNGDGRVTIADVTALIDLLLSGN